MNKGEKIWIRRSGPQVLEAYKRKGIGTILYRIAEMHFRLRIMPDGNPSEEGKRFRERYEKRYGSWEHHFADAASDRDVPTPEQVPFKKDSFIF